MGNSDAVDTLVSDNSKGTHYVGASLIDAVKCDSKYLASGHLEMNNFFPLTLLYYAIQGRGWF